MEKNLLILLLSFTSVVHSQTSLPIKFQVSERASIQMGKEWDFSTEDMNNAINVTFDGKTLKMVYTTGKVYFETPVTSYTTKTIKSKTRIEKDVAILEIKRNGLTAYTLIEYNYSQMGDKYYSIMIPYVLDDGQVFSYERYVQPIKF